jgi:hypothetical protein
LPNIIRVIKSRIMGWAEYVAHMGERRGFWWGSLREEDYLEDPGADERIILKWVFEKWDSRAWTGSV